MDWILRPAAEADLEATVALWRVCGLVVPTNDPAADFRRARGGAASDILLATAGDAVLGSAMVGHDGHRGWVYYLAAAPEARGRGIGRDLLAAAEDWMKARGIPKLHLLVRDSNAAIKAYYRTLGFADHPVSLLQKVLIPFPPAGSAE